MSEMPQIFRSASVRFALSASAPTVATVALLPVRDVINPTTVALGFLMLILSAATFFGRNPALAASLIAMLSFNYYFLPPYETWHIAEPQNLIAWAAFTLTAVIAGELSVYAGRRRAEAERLYKQLQDAFETATKAEAIKQSEKLKSALLDAVTHDIRTPLTSIKASVTTLLESEGGHRTIELDGSTRREFLEIIDEETDRLNRFIEGMVGLARIEAGSDISSGVASSVEEAIAATLVRAENLPGDHRVTVRTVEELPSIKADARAVAEVLYNLIENAFKYSRDGTKVTIEAKLDGDFVLIEVNDQGIGIPPEDRERVFEKFTRVSKTTQDGLGIGLAIVKGIVEAHGGSIELTDGDGGIGTKAVVRLPIAE